MWEDYIFWHWVEFKIFYRENVRCTQDTETSQWSPLDSWPESTNSKTWLYLPLLFLFFPPRVVILKQIPDLLLVFLIHFTIHLENIRTFYLVIMPLSHLTKLMINPWYHVIPVLKFSEMSFKWPFYWSFVSVSIQRRSVCLVVMFLESFNLEHTSPWWPSSPAKFPAPSDIAGAESVVL